MKAIRCTALVFAVAAALPAVAQTPVWSEINLINTNSRSLWVTVYQAEDPIKAGLGITKITHSFCMASGAKTPVTLDLSKVGTFKVRGELTRNPNCAQPVDCDTTVEVASGSWYSGMAKYDFRATPQNCYWQDLRDPSNRSMPGPDPEYLAPKTQAGGLAFDIGIGANGARWVIGLDNAVYRWTGSTWVKTTGVGSRIAVDPQGNPWVVNIKREIWRYNGSTWTQVYGAARDIGIGGDGSVWVIGNDPVGNDFGIYKWAGGTSWEKKPGAALRISVDKAGVAWVVNSTNSVFKWAGSNWQNIPGGARDVSAGGDQVYIAGVDGTPYRLENGNWLRQVSPGFSDVAVDPNGRLCGLGTSDRAVYCVEPAPLVKTGPPPRKGGG